MAYGLAVSVNVTKDGKPFYKESQESVNLDEQQFLEMEQDLWELKKKWATASGLKA